MNRRPPLWYRLRPHWKYVSWVPLLLLLLVALAIYVLDLRTLREALIVVAIYLLLTFLFERYVRPHSHGEITDLTEGMTVGPVERVWFRLQKKMRRFRHDPLDDPPPAGAAALSAKILARVAAEFDATDRAEVERLLLHYMDERQDPDRIRNAVLDLAKGDAEEVRNYVEAARSDFRDVLYWAYGQDNDPFSRLSRLIHDLADQNQVDGGEANQLWVRHGVTNYRDVLIGLSSLLARDGVTLNTWQAAELAWLRKHLKVRQ
jgi:hypothetical protein